MLTLSFMHTNSYKLLSEQGNVDNILILQQNEMTEDEACEPRSSILLYLKGFDQWQLQITGFLNFIR